ncbi:MAG: YCF48-related protein [Bacteroidia bacterium]
MKKTLLIVLYLFSQTISFSQTWTNLTSGTNEGLVCVTALTPTVVYACGSNGTMLKTIDGGSTWIKQITGTNENLYYTFFVDVNRGFAVGDNGAALRTTDGGINWIPMSIAPEYLRSCWFQDATTGYVTGGQSGISGSVYKTIDGGFSWTKLNITTGNIIYSILFTTPSVGYIADYDGQVYKTTDGGATWPTSVFGGYSGSHAKIIFTSLNTGFLCGGDGVISKTTDAGASWNITPSGTSEWLGKIDFIDNNNGFTVGGNPSSSYGIILSTNDGGNTWSQLIFGIARFMSVDFVNAKLAYAVGAEGQIIKWSNTINTNHLDARFTSSEPGCLGQLENFYSVASGTVGITHSWTFGRGATPATSTLSDPTGIVYNITGAKLVTHIVSNGTKSDTVTNIITINPSPTSDFSSNTPVCAKESVNFINSSSATAGVSYAWDFGKNAIPEISTAQTPQGISYQQSGTKTITLTVTNQFGCVTSAVKTIQINALPKAFAGFDTIICANTTVKLGGLPQPGNTYSWFASATLSSLSISNPTAAPIASVTPYMLTVTNMTTGCKNNDTVFVTMLAPLKAYAGIDEAICRHDSIQLGTGLVKGQRYSWSPAKHLNNKNLSNPVATPDSTTTYTITVTGSGCPQVTDEVTIIVHQLPLVNAGMDDTITKGSSIQLNAKGAIQYNWFPESGLNNAGIYNPVANPEKTTSYFVTGTDIFGCVNKDTILITVIAPNFWVPTAFTPDGNGISDIFYVRGEGIQNFECNIFNRWGEQIFNSKNIELGWDGRRQNGGEELPKGAYVYHIKGVLTTGEVINKQGLINLIR